MLVRVLIIGVTIEDIIPSKINLTHNNIEYTIAVSDLNTRYDTDTADLHISYNPAGTLMPLIPAANVISIPQYDKLQQYVFLSDHKIPTPLCVRYLNGVHSRSLSNCSTIDNDTPVIVRSLRGANGLGMFRIPYGVLNSALYFVSLHNNDVDGFKKAYTSASLSPASKDSIVYESNCVIVTEYLTDVKNEYRVVIIGDYITIYKRNRTVKDNELVQANINKDTYFNIPTTHTMVYNNCESTYTEETQSYLDLPVEQYNVILSLTRFMIKHLPMVYGSLDFYLKDNGDVGIFEFSNQFGVAVTPTATTVLYHTEFIKKLVIEYLENPIQTYNN